MDEKNISYDSITEEKINAEKAEAVVIETESAVSSEMSIERDIDIEPDVQKEISDMLKRIEELQQVNNRRLNEMVCKYHNGFADVITRQQAELDMFREGLGRNAVNGILRSVSELYSDYEKYSQCEDLHKVKIGFDSLLEDLLQLLHENGVSEYKSAVGDRYSVKFCKPFDKVKTDSKECHCTVIESRNVGFYIDKTVLVPERVKIYMYDESCTNKETEE